jgi:4-hydroxy-tetrahydrodipicolinate reductase
MKLAIVGYGKMGQLIEQLAPGVGFTVHSVIDEGNDLRRAEGADVAIEFTAPSAVAGNVETLAALRVPVVVGTTGWMAELDRVREAIRAHDVALVWSPNFSIGVNVFMCVVREVARLLAKEPEYGAWAWEIHHETKKDSPSGTLLRLVEEMRAAGYSREIDIASNRAGKHPGTHEIGFDSASDTITLHHSARSREGFARGALKAAQWIVGKKGVFEFSEVFFEHAADRAPGSQVGSR